MCRSTVTHRIVSVLVAAALALSACGTSTGSVLDEAPRQSRSATAPAPGPKLTAEGLRFDWDSLQPGDAVRATFFVPPPLPAERQLAAHVQERHVGNVDRIVINGIPGFDGETCDSSRRHDAAMPIVRSGRLKGGVLQIPSMQEVGWDVTTSQPGARRGVTLLAAHLTAGPVGADQGPLWGAECLPAGSTIRVVWKGKSSTYRVTGEVTKYERLDPPGSIVSPNKGGRIALVTCTGPPRVSKKRPGLWWSRNAAVWAEFVR
ncbi:class F sortase [Nocardioides pinisoli]|uniref:Class F sortase n=1 Tax=Nocardioides pinisoli TaxID=2950279 RepID=A0ABT1KRG9_9ACTN|nr:class F sortase [Nocardioides pinisoli]MCP3420346.1 class F sortase [Nocardioides pinisoli]